MQIRVTAKGREDEFAIKVHPDRMHIAVHENSITVEVKCGDDGHFFKMDLPLRRLCDYCQDLVDESCVPGECDGVQ